VLEAGDGVKAERSSGSMKDERAPAV
jgi:hypothetical protein